jgi:ferric-dicitrate binding protein FerR (iron transport regulator)
MKKEISRELLQKYLRGETTPEETSLIDKWYESFGNAHDEEHSSHIDNNLQERILARIRETVTKEVTSEKKISGSGIWLKWAAAIALIAVAGVGSYIFTKKSPSQQHAAIKQTQTDGIITISNSTASVSSQILSDGSKVFLHPMSSLEFPAVFSDLTRNVHLTGEAFFDVAKNKARPFVITTGDVTIKVLGTSFNVKAYKDENEITVAVKTGKVMVSKSESTSATVTRQEIILTPNQEVVYTTHDSNFQKKLVDQPELIVAKPPVFEMRYDGTPVVDIFKALEASYGIDIEFDGEILAGCALTTSMNEEGLFERIQIICKAIGAQYETTDSAIIIKSNGCR